MSDKDKEALKKTIKTKLDNFSTTVTPLFENIKKNIQNQINNPENKKKVDDLKNMLINKLTAQLSTNQNPVETTQKGGYVLKKKYSSKKKKISNHRLTRHHGGKKTYPTTTRTTTIIPPTISINPIVTKAIPIKVIDQMIDSFVMNINEWYTTLNKDQLKDLQKIYYSITKSLTKINKDIQRLTPIIISLLKFHPKENSYESIQPVAINYILQHIPVDILIFLISIHNEYPNIYTNIDNYLNMATELLSKYKVFSPDKIIILHEKTRQIINCLKDIYTNINELKPLKDTFMVHSIDDDVSKWKKQVKITPFSQPINIDFNFLQKPVITGGRRKTHKYKRTRHLYKTKKNTKHRHIHNKK